MEIKDYLKGEIYYDEAGQMVFCKKSNGNSQLICDIRGWGDIQYLFKLPDGKLDVKKGMEFQDSIGMFIAEAIKEKLEK